MSIVYGVDTSKPITPLQVRDAIIECFTKANCKDKKLAGETIDEASVKNQCYDIVKKGIEEVHGDFNNPTKNILIKTVYYLASFVQDFGEKEMIEKHKKEIMELINKLQD